MSNLALTIKTDNLLDSYTNRINEAIHNIKNEYFYIGALLNEINNNQTYLEHGYKNISEYCENVFGFKKTFTYDLIKVAKRFRDYNGNMFTIDPKYKDYDFSKLCIMASMSDEQLKKCNPSFNIHSIRDVKKYSNPNFDSDKEIEKLEDEFSVRTEKFNNDSSDNHLNFHIKRELISDDYIDVFSDDIKNYVRTYCNSGHIYEFRIIDVTSKF